LPRPPRPCARSAAPGGTADRPRASVAPGPSAAVEAICMTPGSWRTATIEQWHPDQIVRVWRAIDPRPASGPTDHATDTNPALGERGTDMSLSTTDARP